MEKWSSAEMKGILENIKCTELIVKNATAFIKDFLNWQF